MSNRTPSSEIRLLTRKVPQGRGVSQRVVFERTTLVLSLYGRPSRRALSWRVLEQLLAPATYRLCDRLSNALASRFPDEG
ncbi:MAG: hypothetical protein ACO3JL_20200 [Myxococcota bacterium]